MMKRMNIVVLGNTKKTAKNSTEQPTIVKKGIDSTLPLSQNFLKAFETNI